ncbi:MAG TPA: Mur ligase domain-containing protein, partial [Actinomycetota bacterium]|nr:Mur ligase domain-containing protein [Actinomycetota bacterium]
MSGRTLGEVAAVTGGSVSAGAEAVRYHRVSIDTRDTRPGDLFVAITGERSDGHRFVRHAFEAGAVGAV